MTKDDILYRLNEIQENIHGGDEQFDAERIEALSKAKSAVAAMGQLTEEGQRLVWYMPEAVNELAKKINAKPFFSAIGGKQMSGMEAWHLVAPLIAAHSVAQHTSSGSPELNVLDEAYIVVFGALKEYDEKRKQEWENDKPECGRKLEES